VVTPVATMAAMRLTAWEEERLLIFSAAELARRHRAAGLRLNAPEATALICDEMLTAARSGATYEAVMAAGLAAVEPGDVIDGVRELIDEVRLEVLVGDGTRLVVLVDPLGRGRPMASDGPGAIQPGDATRWRAADTAPSRDHAAASPRDDAAASPDDLERRRIVVRSESRRTIRVSSHHPFDRVNARLVFDRAAAAGFRLDLPAGSSERWLPGEAKEVGLVRYGGRGGVDAAGADLPSDPATGK
jgi:urease subunit gamma/beta